MPAEPALRHIGPGIGAEQYVWGQPGLGHGCCNPWATKHVAEQRCASPAPRAAVQSWIGRTRHLAEQAFAIKARASYDLTKEMNVSHFIVATRRWQGRAGDGQFKSNAVYDQSVLL